MHLLAPSWKSVWCLIGGELQVWTASFIRTSSPPLCTWIAACCLKQYWCSLGSWCNKQMKCHISYGTPNDKSMRISNSGAQQNILCNVCTRINQCYLYVHHIAFVEMMQRLGIERNTSRLEWWNTDRSKASWCTAMQSMAEWPRRIHDNVHQCCSHIMITEEWWFGSNRVT